MKHVIVTLLSMLLSSLPSLAWACPSCAGRNEGGIAKGLLIASMIVLPFAITGVVYKVIKGGDYNDD